MNFLLNAIATCCLLILAFILLAGMQGFVAGAPARSQILEGLSAAAAMPATPATAPAPIALATLAVHASPETTNSPLELSAALKYVHVARAQSSLALMMDFSATVNYQTEYELDGHRLGIQVSPVERSALATGTGELETTFGPITIETESPLVHKVWLTLAEGVSPSLSTRAGSGLGRTVLLDFETSGEDRSVEVPQPVSLGKLAQGRKAVRGRGFNFYQYRWVPSGDGAGSDVFVHRVDPARGDFEVQLAVPRGPLHSRQTLSEIARGTRAAGAINAGYFAMSGKGDPLGLLVANGRLLAAPLFSRAAIGIFPGGRVLFGNPELSGHIRTPRGQMKIDALNQGRAEGKLVLFTPEYGERTGTRGYGFEAAISQGRVSALGSADLPIPPDGFVLSYWGDLPAMLASLGKGQEVDFQYGLTPPWNSSLVAVGAGPRLLEKGAAVANYGKERFSREFAQERAPRTAAGLTASGKVVLIAVDGRRPRRSAGVTLPELTQIFRSLGAVDAINLDGGGSTTCWISGQVVNSPSDGRQRPISSALLVVERDPQRVASRATADGRG